MVSAGELGTSSGRLEEDLTKILDLAYRWHAILLLDESDVFLEQRTSNNLEHNQLVSGRWIIVSLLPLIPFLSG